MNSIPSQGWLVGNIANIVARCCGDVTEPQLEARTREQLSVTYIGEGKGGEK